MSQTWRKTQFLFSKPISAPPFLEQYLKTQNLLKKNFDIDATNILKGVEEEKTNIFIQNFF